MLLGKMSVLRVGPCVYVTRRTLPNVPVPRVAPIENSSFFHQLHLNAKKLVTCDMF